MVRTFQAAVLALSMFCAGCGEEGTGAERARDLEPADAAPGEAAPKHALSLDGGALAQADTGAEGEPAPLEAGAPAAQGACASETDRAVVLSLDEQLSCEGAACVARNLRIGLPSGIDAEGTALCVREQAPNLARLSGDCQACFVRISLCAPESCVALLGGESNACGGSSVPSPDFASCSAPSTPEPACADCQKERCQAEFIACSGIEAAN